MVTHSQFDNSSLCLFKYRFCLRILNFLAEVVDFSFNKCILSVKTLTYKAPFETVDVSC